jgi:hypothetical protein
MLKGFIIVASLAASSAALAAPAHLSDGQYLSAVRCRALIASPALGKGDTSAVDAMLKAESGGRNSVVFDRAEEVRGEAVRAAGRAGPDERGRLIAERNGACQAFGDSGTTTAAVQMAQPTGAN